MITRELIVPNQTSVSDPAEWMEPIHRRLLAWGPLNVSESRVLGELAATAQSRPPRAVLAAEGASPSAFLLASGWACRQHLLSDGRRQIISFVLPGDPLFPVTRPALPLPCSAVALTPVTLVDAAGLLAHADADVGMSGLARSLRRMDLHEEYLARDHVVRLGRQVAYERMIHLMLELFERLSRVGLTTGGSFPLPLTQEVLADTLGLSVVHVNRVLQQIRREKLLDLRGGSVTILKMDQMRQLADWVPFPKGP